MDGEGGLQCRQWSCQLQTTITTTLNSFTTIKRDCSSTCAAWCESVGYGPNQVSCTDCCQKSNCNSNHTLSYYKHVMKRQFTSATKALDNEVKFNRQANIKFPY